jgi:ribosomal protein S18 acetylase RimI-like enzyme
MRAGAEVLGYIQEVALDMHGKTATVGHFAVATDYSRMGLGKRMAQGFAKMLKDGYGITAIIFDERSRKVGYEVFFEHVLRAERIGAGPNDKWRWVWLER